MSNVEAIKKAEHERIWLEPDPGEDPEGRMWCQDNQWGDDGVEYVLASTLEALQRENERLQSEIDRTERNRDMWKGQVERQADRLSKFRKEEISLRETLFKCGSFIADRYQEGDAEYQVVLLVNDAICGKPALDSAGGEHHAE